MPIRRADNLPRPHNLESKALFGARWAADPGVRSRYTTSVKRRLMAEKAWLRAKGDSTVSISTSEGEFLLFGA